MNQEQKQEERQERIKVEIAPDVEYVYRDMVNISAKPDALLLEFGNEHLIPPGTITISNRIILSPRNAYRLYQTLGQTLQALERQSEENSKNE